MLTEGETVITPSRGPGAEFDGLPPGAAAIVEGDALALLADLPDGCIDLVITSPPYNQGASPSAREHPMSSRGQGKNWVGYGDDRDCLPEPEYQAAQRAILAELYRVTRPGGMLFYVHKDRLWDGRLISPLTWLQASPWAVRQQIVWNRGAGHRRDGWHFDPLHEYVFHLVKGTTIGNLGAAARYSSVWHIPPDNQPDWHPAPFPLALAARCILAGSAAGDLVLDPYCGSATVLLSALENGRRGLGFERCAAYIGPARSRLAAYRLPLPGLLEVA